MPSQNSNDALAVKVSEVLTSKVVSIIGNTIPTKPQQVTVLATKRQDLQVKNTTKVATLTALRKKIAATTTARKLRAGV